MKQCLGLRIDVPIGIIDRPIGIFFLSLMREWAPPIFHDLYEIHGVPQERNTERAIHFTVKYPVPLVVREREYIARHDGLCLVDIPMRDPRRHEIPIPFHILCAETPQMPPHDGDPDKYEWCRREEGEVYKGNSDNDAKKYWALLEILAELHPLRHFVEYCCIIHMFLTKNNT